MALFDMAYKSAVPAVQVHWRAMTCVAFAFVFELQERVVAVIQLCTSVTVRVLVRKKTPPRYGYREEF